MLSLLDGMMLYHGSYMPVERVDLCRCKPGKDFGQGFYVTSSLDQARAFVPLAVRRQAAEHASSADAACGYVSAFRYHVSDDIYVHIFGGADAEWLHFVAANRRPDLFPTVLDEHRGDDIICGKIADDRTARTLQLYVSEAYGKPGSPEADTIAIATLLPNRLEDQFCFRTDAAIACLEFVGSDRHDVIR